MVFKKELESQEAVEGGSVSLTCEISADGKVTWRRGSVLLTQGEKYSMEHTGSTYILMVHKLKVEDAGEYTCDTGDKQSTATLTVKGNETWLYSCLSLLVCCHSTLSSAFIMCANILRTSFLMFFYLDIVVAKLVVTSFLSVICE